jgi:small subunit ribosomal protein S4
MEKQFRKYFSKAAKNKAATGEKLLQFLESRLDNVVFRLGFAPSRSVARQLITHGHVLVDNQKVTIPSYRLKQGETITMGPKSLKLTLVKKALADKDRKIPDWLKRKAVVGQVARLPKREEIDTEVDEHLILEFYSR